MSKGRVAACIVAAFVIFEGLAFGQASPNGTVRGYAKDEQNAVLPGVVVTATSPTAPGVYSTVTDHEGFYRLLNLPPATYLVRAELQGFSSTARDGIAVRAGLTLLVDIVMKVGNVAETVEVHAEPPLLESRSAATALNISGELQRSLPLSRRGVWYDALRLVPATVNERGGSASAFEQFYVNGSEFSSHVIQLDGIDVAPAAQSSNLYNFMSTEVLQDVQIKTSGVDVSSPIGEGAVINMVSRSGSNSWQGGANLVYQGKSWNSNNNPSGTTSATSNVQPDVTAGGPLRHDQSWLFGSYRHTDINNSLSRTDQQLATLQALVHGYEPLDRTIAGIQTFLKSTTQISARHRLTASDQYSFNKLDNVTALDTVKSLKSQFRGQTVSTIVDSVWSKDLTTRFAASYNNLTNPTSLDITDSPSHIVTAGIFKSSGVWSNTGTIAQIGNSNLATFQEAPTDKLTFTGDATLLRNWQGAHELQAGFYLQPKRLYAFTGHFANGGFVAENDVLVDPAQPSKGYQPYSRTVYSPADYEATNVNTQDYAGYVQDTWKVSRATVTAGVRVDRIKGFDRIFNVPTKDMTAVGPRVGVVMLPTKDGRHAVRASLGIVHDAVATNTAAAGSVTATIVTSYDLDLNGTFETPITTPGSSAINPIKTVDLANYHQPYVRDAAIGYTVQWPSRWTTDVSFRNRAFKERIANVAVNSQYNGKQFIGYANPAQLETYTVTSNTWNWPVYNDVTLQVTRENPLLRVVASYTRQWRHLTGSWQPNDPASFIQPEAFANDRGIGSTNTVTTNSLSGTDMTGAPQWRDHTATAGLSGKTLGNVIWGLSYSFQSGPWSGPIITRLAQADPQFGPGLVTLSNGRVVSNPLATTLRFAGPTRGDGQLTLPAMHILNLRIGRQFKWRNVQLDPAIDLLNALNGGASYDFMFNGNQTFSTAYRQSTNVQNPRSAQLTVRLSFQ